LTNYSFSSTSSAETGVAASGQESLLDVPAVARMCNVSESWIRDHCGRKRPLLPVVRLGSLLRFRKEDIQQWIDEMRDRSK
jgi:predicted DNA-binding transcriptional regulator AlpA